jgi:hypothetical protein
MEKDQQKIQGISNSMSHDWHGKSAPTDQIERSENHTIEKILGDPRRALLKM